jgi:hypothetical protein
MFSFLEIILLISLRKKKVIVTLFIYKTETIRQTQIIKETIWLKHLIEEIDPIDLIYPINIYNNNQGAIALAKNP